MLQKDLMSLTLYISSNCKSPIIYDFEFFLRVRSQSQVFVVFAVKGCPGGLIFNGEGEKREKKEKKEREKKEKEKERKIIRGHHHL